MHKALSLAFAFAIFALPAAALARTAIELPRATCAPAYQTVPLGATAHFYAISNTQGPFTWVNNGYSVLDAGPDFYAQMQDPGEQRVYLVWGSQRSYCTVQVGGSFDQPIAGPSPLNVTLASVFYPSWPNTGFAPQTLAAFAFIAVFLIGAVIALYPHVKRAFVIVTR
jgi:hypothetical protein